MTRVRETIRQVKQRVKEEKEQTKLASARVQMYKSLFWKRLQDSDEKEERKVGMTNEQQGKEENTI